jgi:flotillin
MFLLQSGVPSTEVFVAIVGVAVVIFFVLIFIATRFKRCPSNRVLVVYGKVGKDRTAKCIHGGGAFIFPLIQDYGFLDLLPRPIDIDLIGALSKQNIRVNVPSTFTVGISTRPEITHNAAERLLGLNDVQIREQAKDIILGQMRLVIATLNIEEINQDREKFLDLVTKNVGTELQKVGLEVINVNIRDITDESGYIEAIGKRAAAEAINQARVEVAKADMTGAIGETEAVREKQVRVSEQSARSVEGQKDAEKQQRVAVASLEAEAIKGENESKGKIAQANANLAEQEAEARRRAEVARASAERDVLDAQKQQELARLGKVEVAQQEINKQKMEIEADAKAEQTRRMARGEADAILSVRTAEAEGQRLILEAKAKGYERLFAACGGRTDLAPTLLMIEKLTDVVSEQVKAIQNLKIDKITVWDSGANGNANGHGGGTTASFLSSLLGALPPMHELARQAGIELPQYLGRVSGDGGDKPATRKEEGPGRLP